jgi:hypothetical protein
VSAVVSAVGAARTSWWAWSTLTQGRPSKQLRNEAHESAASWKRNLLRVPQNQDLFWEAEKASDITQRSIILLLQCSNVFVTKSEERSRIMLVSSVVDPAIKYRKNADSSNSYGRYLLKELLVDIHAFVYIEQRVGTKSWSLRRGRVVRATNSAHVLEMIIMRSHRHCVMLMEAIRLKIMGRTDNFMSRPVALYRFKKSFLWESTSHVEAQNATSPMGEVVTTIVVDPAHGVAGASESTVSSLLDATCEPGAYCSGLEPSATELDRIMKGISAYQDMKANHLGNSADWVTYVRAFLERDLRDAEKVNPSIQVLRKAATKYLEVAHVVNKNGGLKNNLLSYASGTVDLLILVIGLTFTELPDLKAGKDHTIITRKDFSEIQTQIAQALNDEFQ